MFNIRDYLRRATGVQARELYFRRAVQEALKKLAGIDLPFESISSKSGTVELKGISQEARSAIFIKKAALIAEINKEQDVRPIKDIR